jgi:hypothetical protein
MTFKKACSEAVKNGSWMIRQTNSTWHQRGIKTEFTSDERDARNWEPVPINDPLYITGCLGSPARRIGR